MGDGGKWICDPHSIGTHPGGVRGAAQLQGSSSPSPKGCLVYSLGSSNEFSFEMDVLARHPNCEIHTFDLGTNPASDPRIHFHRWGVAKVDNVEANMYSLLTIQKKLGHMDRQIDIFKMDIEGSEYEVGRV